MPRRPDELQAPPRSCFSIHEAGPNRVVALPFPDPLSIGTQDSLYHLPVNRGRSWPSARIISASILRMQHAENSFTIRFKNDGKNSTTFRLYSPSRSGNYNLAHQCYRGVHEVAAGDTTGTFEYTLQWNTNRPACDGETVSLPITGTRANDRTINNGDFYDPIRIILLGNNTPVAYIRCSLPAESSSQSCEWTYPSAYDAAYLYEQFNARYEPTSNLERLRAGNLGWSNAFNYRPGRPRIYRNGSAESYDHYYSTIKGQIFAVLLNACAKAINAPRASLEGAPRGDRAALARYNFARGCIRKWNTPGRPDYMPGMNEFVYTFPANQAYTFYAEPRNQMRLLHELLPSYTNFPNLRNLLCGFSPYARIDTEAAWAAHLEACRQDRY